MMKKGSLWLILGILVVVFSLLLHTNKEVENVKKVEPTIRHEEIVFEHKVLLDAGHGGYDAGCESVNNHLEKDVNLAITLKAGAILAKHGVEVVYTRDSDQVIWEDNNIKDLRKRSEIANASKADLFISIHANSNDDESIKGYEIWYSDVNKGSKALADIMAEFFMKDPYSTDRGVRNDEYAPLSLLYYNKIPSILIECGFLTNPEDEKILISEQGQNDIANRIAQGILASLDS